MPSVILLFVCLILPKGLKIFMLRRCTVFIRKNGRFLFARELIKWTNWPCLQIEEAQNTLSLQNTRLDRD